MANVFRPVKGTEAEILAAENVAGYLYFAVDTGKIYLGNGGKAEDKIAMGRNSGVYYGNKIIGKNDNSNQFEFTLSELGVDLLPNIGDLILNTPNGGFYKVVELKEESCLATPITVAGQSSGASIYYIEQSAKEETDGSYSFDLSSYEEEVKVGDILLTDAGSLYRITELSNDTAICSVISSGNGGGGGNTPADRLNVSLSGIRSFDILILGQKAEVNVTVSSEHESIVKVPVNVTIINEYGGEQTTIVKQFTATNGVSYPYDLGALLPLGTNKVTFTAVSEFEGNEIRGANSLMSLSTVVMSLNKSSNFNALRNWGDATTRGVVDFRCIPIGQDLNKTLYIDIDGVRRDDLTKRNITTSGAEVQVPITGLTHGRHLLTATLTTNEDMVSSSISYQIAYLEENNTTPIIWAKEYNLDIVDHEPLVVDYMVYDPASPARTSVTYYVNGSVLATGTIDAAYSATNWITWRIPKYNVGENELIIMCNGEALTLSVNVKEDSRDLNIIDSGLILNLDAEGRSNKENISSRNIWHTEGKEDYVTFKDFNWYNNGWIMDDDGNTCLRVSNGASVSIPLNILKDRKLRNSYTMEFIFKIRNVQKYSALITTKEDPETHETWPEVSSTEGVCLKYYNAHVGWCLGTQETFFTSKNKTISGRYVEDEVVHLSYVIEDPSISEIPLCYIYLNGLLTGVTTYDRDTENFNTEKELQFMEINSDYCDIDIYKIRIYESNLMAKDIVHNYIADKVDIDLYDANQIVEYNNNIPNIDFKLMRQYNIDHPEAPMMPYAVIETTDLENTLPYKKLEDKDLESFDAATGEWKSRKAWSVNIEFVNPSLDYAYEHKLITDEQYIKGCPSYTSTGVDLNVQGTSSQGYPRRNYKAKFKKADSWLYTNGPLAGKKIGSKNTLNGINYKNWYMDSEIPTNKFTWKADYMESSGTHNGGLASFLGTVYDKHPIQDYGINKDDADKLRTTVYGFPMMVFHKKSGGTANGEIQFIGRYIYLLDKGCDDNFGFSGVDGESKVNGEDGKLSLEDVAECWQIEDNQGGRCSFKCNYTKEDENGNTVPDYDKILTDTYLTADDRTTLAIGRDFSVRYHADKDNIELAIDQRHEFQNNTDIANQYLMEKYKNLADLITWVASTDTTAATNLPLSVEKYGFTTDSKEYRLAKFTREFTEHFDLHYSIIYFIITEILMCFDSRGKNMMIATWGPVKEGGNYIWYPIFYDMDTQLGINNSGVPYWDYYEEVTNNGTFSTPDSVLWNNLWSCFKTDILTAYNGLRTKALTEVQLNGYYDFDPLVSKSYAMKGIRPLIMQNIDEYYKYIDCAVGSGYRDTANKVITTSGYFYCLQGDRKMRRNMLLRNRFNYYDSMWMGGSYSYTTAVNKQQRAGCNNWPNGSDRYLVMPENKWMQEYEDKGFIRLDNANDNSLNADLDFELTPYLKQYMSIYFDKTAQAGIYCEDGQTITLKLPKSLQDTVDTSTDKSDQLFYLGGLDYLSSFGDLSSKYIDRLDLASAKRLKDLILGNDDPNYFNNKLKVGENFTVEDHAKTADGTVNPNAKTLLEKVVLSNLHGLEGTLDFSGSEKLKELRALGTNLNSIVLADGVQVEKLFLPKTITNIKLIEPTSLTEYLTAKPVAIDDVYPNGLYLEDVTDNTEILPTTTTALTDINIIGGAMGYNSYKLTDIVLAIKESMIENYATINTNKLTRELQINLERVNWSPYRLVEYGETINPEATYVLKTPHFTFESYMPTEADWGKNTLNSKVYEYIATSDVGVITDLSLLDKFIDHYRAQDGYIHGNNGSDSLVYLSGTMFVNNDADHPIHETQLRDYYMGTYFPELSIYVANPAGDNIAQFIEIVNNVEIEVDSLAFGDDVEHVVPTSEAPSVRPHWDWLGWSIEPDGEIIEDWSQYKFDATHKDYTFYAVYEKHKHSVKFMDGDNATPVDIIGITYGTKAYETKKVPTRPTTGLSLTKGWNLLGWSRTPIEGTGTTEDVENISEITVLDDMVLYPIFEQVEDIRVHSVAVNFEKYFNCTSAGVVTVKSGVQLSGKIVIPSTINGMTAKSLGNNFLANNTTVTHVLFENGNSISLFGEKAFQNSHVVYCEPNQALEEIGSYAFSGARYLTTYDWTKTASGLAVTKLGVIRTSAFSDAFADGTHNLYFPGSVRTIEASTFAYYSPTVDIDTIQFGSEADPSALVNVVRTSFTQNTGVGYPSAQMEIYAYYRSDDIAAARTKWSGVWPADQLHIVEI